MNRFFVLFLCLISLAHSTYSKDVQKWNMYETSSRTFRLSTMPGPTDHGTGESDLVALTARSEKGLDDPGAMEGQIIVDPKKPRWLKYNGGRNAFLCGPGNPEDFFYRGSRRPDGTRDVDQMDIIKRLEGTGANTLHVMALRDSRYNHEGQGSPTQNPFVDSNINNRLDDDILAQWEPWLDELERIGVIVLFNFYNDFDDYEKFAGWTLQPDGSLHPQDAYLIRTLVNRFKHHKNIIWAIEESCNKLSRAKQRRFKKIAELVAQTDNFHHPICQMFMVLYYGEVHPDKVNPLRDYVNDPHIKVMAWAHYATPEKKKPSLSQYHKELVDHRRQSQGRFVVFKNEMDKGARNGNESRWYAWATAMAGMYDMIAKQHPYADGRNTTVRATLEDDGRVVSFFESFDYTDMEPSDNLAHGSTLYVLADASRAYVGYSREASSPMGFRKLPAGKYYFRWFDTTNGEVVEQHKTLSAGDHLWNKPSNVGKELALYIKRLGD